jgi:hypothetical protein
MIMVKEEFPGSPKWWRAIELGGWQAIGLWLCLKAYAAANPTDGFIPDEEVPRLPGVPKDWKNCLKALLECGKKQPDGTRGPGLLEKHPHGWALHHYLDHAKGADELVARTDKERRRKALQRALKRFDVFGIAFDQMRKLFPGDSDPEEALALFEAMRDGTKEWDPEGQCPRDARGTDDGTGSGTDTGHVGGTSLAPPASTHASAPTGGPTQPNPAQPDPEITSPPTRARAKGERPRPRPTLLAVRVTVAAYTPLPEHREYATELGVTSDGWERLLLAFRDFYGGKPHDEAYLDDRLCGFIEQEAKPKPATKSGPRSRGPVQSGPLGYDPTARARAVAEREEAERKAAGGAP